MQLFYSYVGSWAYYIDAKGINMLRYKYTSRRGDFPDIVNKVSVNLSPFKTIRFLVTNLITGRYSEVTFWGYLYKTDKTMLRVCQATEIPSGDTYVTWDVSTVNQHVFISWVGDFYYATGGVQAGEERIIIKKIEFLT